jgi:hypothetical protein
LYFFSNAEIASFLFLSLSFLSFSDCSALLAAFFTANSFWSLASESINSLSASINVFCNVMMNFLNKNNYKYAKNVITSVKIVLI